MLDVRWYRAIQIRKKVGNWLSVPLKFHALAIIKHTVQAILQTDYSIHQTEYSLFDESIVFLMIAKAGNFELQRATFLPRFSSRNGGTVCVYNISLHEYLLDWLRV